jgi:hypothetical protein
LRQLISLLSGRHSAATHIDLDLAKTWPKTQMGFRYNSQKQKWLTCLLERIILHFSIPLCIRLVQPVMNFDLLCLVICKENNLFLVLSRLALMHFITLQSARRPCCSARRSFLKSIIELYEWRWQQWPLSSCSSSLTSCPWSFTGDDPVTTIQNRSAPSPATSWFSIASWMISSPSLIRSKSPSIAFRASFFQASLGCFRSAISLDRSTTDYPGYDFPSIYTSLSLERLTHLKILDGNGKYFSHCWKVVLHMLL